MLTSPARGVPPAVLPLGGLRVAGGVMLAAAAVRPLVPGTPGIACPLRSLTGIPCPLCGMTTSVTAAVHLDVPTALAANPAGVAAVAAAVVLLVGRRRPTVAVPSWVLPVVLALMWAFQLVRFT